MTNARGRDARQGRDGIEASPSEVSNILDNKSVSSLAHRITVDGGVR